MRLSGGFVSISSSAHFSDYESFTHAVYSVTDISQRGEQKARGFTFIYIFLRSCDSFNFHSFSVFYFVPFLFPSTVHSKFLSSRIFPINKLRSKM